MRLICELFLAALLIWLGWEKSFHAWANQWRGIPETPPAATAAAQTQSTTDSANASVQTTPHRPFVGFPPRAAAAPSTPSGQWMWDPGHRSTLDAPATKAGSGVNPTAPPSQSYWIDGQGVKHSTNAPPPTP